MLQVQMNRLTAGTMSQSVTTTGLNVAHLLQIETNRPARLQTTTKAPPLYGGWVAGIEKVPAGRVLDGDFAV